MFLVNCLCPVIHCDTLICGNHPPHLRGAGCVYRRSHLPLVGISPVTALWAAGKTAIMHSRLAALCHFATCQTASRRTRPLANDTPPHTTTTTTQPLPVPPNLSLQVSVLGASHTNKGFPENTSIYCVFLKSELLLNMLRPKSHFFENAPPGGKIKSRLA